MRVGDEPLQLITVCRLTADKNTAAIIQALPEILHTLPQTHLTVLGDGPEMPHLQSLVKQLGLEAHVQFMGNVNHDEVVSQLQKAHLFVFPTKVKEGFPKAVLEAMVCGLPVIASDVSVIPYLIGEQERGVVLEEPTAEAVTKAVLEIAANPEKMGAMGKQAREMSQQYTLEHWQAILQQRLEQAWGQPLKTR